MKDQKKLHDILDAWEILQRDLDGLKTEIIKVLA
jgi:hypothetical protein